MFGVWGKKF